MELFHSDMKYSGQKESNSSVKFEVNGPIFWWHKISTYDYVVLDTKLVLGHSQCRLYHRV